MACPIGDECVQFFDGTIPGDPPQPRGKQPTSHWQSHVAESNKSYLHESSSRWTVPLCSTSFRMSLSRRRGPPHQHLAKQTEVLGPVGLAPRDIKCGVRL